MRSVFVSYRRGDSEGQARALNFELVKFIGKDSVFMDVDSIALGQDFRNILHERLESCDLMLALIGPGWLDAKDAAGNRRLESATDLVRQEIAAALKRNIPVTPVLLQGAQMPPAERLPDDIKDLVYRNGFELGHSTWESDVNEMVKRLGLDKAPAAPAPGPVEAGAKSAVLAAPGPSKTSWFMATFAIIAIVAAVFFYRKAHDQSTAREIVAPLQQPAGSSPQQSTGPAPQLPVGFGAITIANLKTRSVEVYAQSSSGDSAYVAGYAGTISPSTTTLHVPAGTYKLKFANLFVQQVAVTSAPSPAILLGAISVPHLTRTAEVYDQTSSGDSAYVAGYAGTLSPTTTTLQVPAGTYKLKFANLFVQHLAVTSARSPDILLGTISLPNINRTVEVYDQTSSGDSAYVAGYAGTISPTATTLQVPVGTYKLKFANLFVQPVRVESGKTVIAQ
jgi:TIR domain-containing protein